jgi:hypothetical protein
MSSNKPEPIVLNSPESIQKISRRILEKTLQDSRQSKLIIQMLTDPDCDRNALFINAFCMGVVSAMLAVSRGNLRLINETDSTDGKN